jgi:hypothetical protein
MFPSDTLVEFLPLEELESNADTSMSIPEKEEWELLVEEAQTALRAQDLYCVRGLLDRLAFVIPKLKLAAYKEGLNEDFSDLPF